MYNFLLKKSNVFFLFFFLFIKTSIAQFNENPVVNIETYDEPLLNWGFILGFNQYDFKYEYREDLGDILIDKSFGFNVGLIGELRLNKYFDLRIEPMLAMTQRTIGFRGFTEERDALREVQSTYLNFPLLIKAGAKRIGDWRPIILGGVSYSINLGSNEDSLEDNTSGTFRMKKDSYYYELGFGIEFYTANFKFTPSIRGVFALNDELVRDNDPNSPWTGNIAAMKTRGIFINFTFE